MTAHVIMLCHAPTRAVRTSSFPVDEPLDPPRAALPEIRAEIEKLGTVEGVVAGPELRTTATAAALEMILSTTIDPALRDCDYARWRGRRFRDLQEEEPEALASWVGDPDANPHGGETITELLRRVASWMDERGRIGGRVLAVTHPTVIRAAMTHALQAAPPTFWRINAEPLSLCDLRGYHGRWTLRSLSSPRV